jgi:hypothetical protein
MDATDIESRARPLADRRPYLTHVLIDMTMLQQFLGVPNLDGSTEPCSSS